MVNAFYVLRVERDCFTGLYQLLARISQRTKFAGGSLQSGIWHNPERDEIVINEVWRTVEEFDRYVSSDLYRELLTAFELCSEEPGIQIIEFEKSWGLEWIERVRTRDKVNKTPVTIIPKLQNGLI